MNYYRESSLKIFYFMIFPIFFTGFLFIGYKAPKICILLVLCYLLLVISVALPIVKRRKEIKEIQKNGRCYAGTVEKLMEIKVGTTYNRFGHTEYQTAYYLKVLPQGESNANHFVYSDILVGSKGQKIAKDVLIYDWYGKTFVVCTKIKRKKHYEVEHARKVVDYSWNRKCLIYVNQFLVMADILLILALMLVLIYTIFIEN